MPRRAWRMPAERQGGAARHRARHSPELDLPTPGPSLQWSPTPRKQARALAAQRGAARAFWACRVSDERYDSSLSMMAPGCRCPGSQPGPKLKLRRMTAWSPSALYAAPLTVSTWKGTMTP